MTPPSLRTVPVDGSFALEDCPFDIVQVDVTHRCNMACANCYIPNRDVPDLDADWILSMLARLPPRRNIRLVGAEPTMRSDLPETAEVIALSAASPELQASATDAARRGAAAWWQFHRAADRAMRALGE